MSKPQKDKFDSILEEQLEYAYLELGDISKIKVTNQLMQPRFNKLDDMPENLIAFMRNPKNFWFTCKYLLNVEITPIQQATLMELWTKPYPMLIASRGAAKSFLLSLYIILRALFDQGSKIVVVGAALRQSMLLFEYVKNFWSNAPILRNICGGSDGGPKKELHIASWACGQSTVRFLPMGDGETIRGQRASVLIADEFSSLEPNIFELVVRGFAAVKSKGMMESVKYAYRQKMLKEMGLISEENLANSRLITTTSLGTNQIVIAGTTSFQFNHFYKYFKLYKAIIESKGDQAYIREHYPDMNINSDIDHRDYSILRLPYTLMPDGMMDKGVLAQARAAMNSVLFDQEYGCVFPSDSDGFYPASVIHACTCPVKGFNDEIVDFKACLNLKDDDTTRCVMGIDPASEKDNFAIHIMAYGPQRKCLYQWTTNRKKFQKKKSDGLIDPNINDYNSYCIRQIRDLVKAFRVCRIVCDAGGGGLSVREGLKDKDKMNKDEHPIYDMEDETVAGLPGNHMLTLINFSDANWRKEAHWGLKTDLNDRRIVFPKFDSVVIAEGFTLEKSERDQDRGLENVYLELEELKRETMLIKHEVTSSNQMERWVVPELKIAGADDIKDKLKRDRFTSLLLANWACRMIDFEEGNKMEYTTIGSVVGVRKKPVEDDGAMYYGFGTKRMKTMGGDIGQMSGY